MTKQKQFELLWKDFLIGKYSERPSERIKQEEIARMFFEFGYSRGILK